VDKPVAVLAVGAVLYRYDQRGKLNILLIKKLGGYWTLPKGKLILGESENEALLREIAEETGLTGEIGPPIQVVSYTIVKKGQTLRKQVTYYLIRIDGGELQLSEAEQIIKARWFAPQAAHRRLRRGRLRVILRRACRLLSLPYN
jgi:8-oxo-dGTP diphosphatase